MIKKHSIKEKTNNDVEQQLHNRHHHHETKKTEEKSSISATAADNKHTINLINEAKRPSSVSLTSASCTEEFESDRSEFGETINHNKLYEKLPEIQRSMAHLLKLEVKVEIN